MGRERDRQADRGGRQTDREKEREGGRERGRERESSAVRCDGRGSEAHLAERTARLHGAPASAVREAPGTQSLLPRNYQAVPGTWCRMRT